MAAAIRAALANPASPMFELLLAAIKDGDIRVLWRLHDEVDLRTVAAPGGGDVAARRV